MKKGNLLIVYASPSYRMLKTFSNLTQMIYSFKHYSNYNCFFYDASVRKDSLAHIHFDAILFVHFIHLRGKKNFKDYLKNLSWLKKYKCKKAVFPQDEYYATKDICEFCTQFNISHMFTLAPESEWQKMFGDICDKVEISRVMPGYLDNIFLKKLSKIEEKMKNKRRTVDIGYRTHSSPASLGRHNWQKTRIADVFIKRLKNSEFKIDISYDVNKKLVGDSWYEFLLNCRYTIGVEGGASILDYDGKLLHRTITPNSVKCDGYLERMEKKYFPGRDGEINYVMISPRHLEAAATKTCQILIEGEYNGVLKPWRHYIPLKKDYSNLEEVIELMKDEEKRLEMVERSYREVALSKYNTLKYFVRFVLKTMDISQSRVNTGDNVYRIVNAFLEFVFRSINLNTYIL